MRQRNESFAAQHENGLHDVSPPVLGSGGHSLPELLVHSGLTYLSKIGIKTNLLTITETSTGRPTETNRKNSSNEQNYQKNGLSDPPVHTPRQRRPSVFRRSRDEAREAQNWAEVHLYHCKQDVGSN